MTTTPQPLTKHLQALKDLLSRERLAITQLRMHDLTALQQEKTRLLALINAAGTKLDAEGTALAKAIKQSNERNRVLLESGLRLIHQMQENVHRNLALTYAAHGRSLNVGVGPRLLHRSI